MTVLTRLTPVTPGAISDPGIQNANRPLTISEIDSNFSDLYNFTLGKLAKTTDTFTGTLSIAGQLRFNGSVSGYVGFQSASTTANVLYTLPTSDGLNGQVLSTNGTGSLSWINQSAGGGGGGSGSGTSTSRTAFTATAGQTTFSVTYVVGQIDVYMNGSKLIVGTEVTASNGTSVVLAEAASAGDIVEVVVYSTQWISSGSNLYYDQGNVGFGVTNPAARIHIGSAATALATGTLRIDGADGAGTVNAPVTLNSVTDGATASGGSQFYVETRIPSGALTEKFRIDGDGNVGIGTNNPTAKLHVEGSLDASVITQTVNTSTGTSAFAQTTAVGNDTTLRLTAYGSNHTARGSTAWLNVNEASRSLVLATGNSERMRIDANGNVGIGASPSAKLHVAPTPGVYNATVSNVSNIGGGILIRGTDSGANSRVGLFLQGSDQIGAAIAAAREDAGTTWKTYLAFYTNNLTGGNVQDIQEKMRLDSAGNLGLGTASPGYRFEAYLTDATANRTNPIDVAAITAYSGNAPYDGFGPGLVFKSTDYGSSTPRVAARIRSSLNDNSINTFGSSLVFDTTPTRGGSLTKVMELNYAGNLGLGVTPSVTSALYYRSFELGKNGSGLHAPTVSLTASELTWLTNNSYPTYSAGTVWKYGNDGPAVRYALEDGVHLWYTAPSGTAGNTVSFGDAKMVLDAIGQLSIGGVLAENSVGVYLLPTGEMRVKDNTEDGVTAQISIYNNNTSLDSEQFFVAMSAAEINIGNRRSGAFNFYTNNQERARITSGGDLLVGTTTSYGSRKFEVRGGAAATFLSTFGNTNSNPLGVQIYYDGYDPNGVGNEFLNCNGNGTVRTTIRSNGGLANYSANDVNLSDRREKTNFAPAKSYLDTICAIPVQTFNYIDQSEDDPGLTLGVVAQDVQAVAPELVMESNWGTEDNPRMRLSIYQTDLQYALMKCIQEQQALITALTARVAALET